jgi:hypothetical protein
VTLNVLTIQEDPYKLVLLSKDIQRVCVTRADFLFSDNDLRLVTGDEEGILRTYEYNPQGGSCFYFYFLSCIRLLLPHVLIFSSAG